jgi:hypothetical protein
MKKYKYNEIKKLSYDDIIEIYKINKIDFDLDMIRLKKFIQGNVEDINISKNEISNISQTEDANQLVNTEDANQLVNTEDANQLVNTEDANQLVNTEDANQLVNTEDSIESNNKNDIDTLIYQKDIVQEIIPHDNKSIQNTKYIEEYINEEINTKKDEENNFNIYNVLLLIPIFAFILFVKK